MASAAFWHRGESLDYKNTGNEKIEANTIVVYGARIGVVGCNIAPGETGSLHVTGVFEVPKTDSAAIEAGAEVYWDGSGITTTAGSTKAGFAAQAAEAADTKILVKINA